jgi:LCP family protein required for cell wall assembly
MSDDASMQRRGHAHPHVRRALLSIAASISLLIALLAGGATGMYVWAQQQIRYIPDLPGPAVSPGASPAVDIGGPCDRHACNYLLLGSDSRKGLTPEELQQFGTVPVAGQRSDTIILVHVEPDQKKAIFLSFPRDLWVDIPGHGVNRINTAFDGGIAGGGAQMVARTIKSLTGLQTNHVLYVDLAGFQGVVDALGGVDMCVPYPMQDVLTGLNIQAGCQHFDGKTALEYVRTRHQPCDLIPDFARISRQQQFLRAVIAKTLSPSELLQLPSLVPAVLKSVVVDKGLNPAELVYLANELNGVNTGNADFRVVPSVPEGVYVNGQYLSVVRLVQPQADELFARLREGKPLGDLGLTQAQTAPSPAIIKVAVYDKRSQGMAATVYDTLTQGGFDTSVPVQDAGALGSIPAKGSMILYDPNSPDGQAMADVVQGYLSNLQEVAAPQRLLGDADVAIVIGPNYRLPPPNTSPPVSCP